jgi:hypothetical protein
MNFSTYFDVQKPPCKIWHVIMRHSVNKKRQRVGKEIRGVLKGQKKKRKLCHYFINPGGSIIGCFN